MFHLNFGEDADMYKDSTGYGDKHWELRHVVEKSPLEWQVDVNMCCKVIVETTIVFNCLQLGICVHPDDDEMLYNVCTGSDFVFTMVFCWEFCYKLYKLRCMYFRSNWNRFDLFLLMVTLVDIVIYYADPDPDPNSGLQVRNFLILKCMRLMRIIRILRVLQHKNEMRMVMEGLVASFQSMIWVALMLGMLIYVAAIVCVTFFRTVETPIALDFATMPRAMFSLFTLAIVADWTDLVMPVISKYWWSPLFFVLFCLCATFGIMNLIIGVITERTARVKEAYYKCEELRADSRRMENIKEIAEIMFRECESQGDEEQPTITKTRMQDFTNSEQHGHKIQELIEGVSLPAGFEVHDCHAMFDRDGTGTITQQEFVQGMGRLIFSSEFQRSCIMQSSLADVMAEMKAIERRIMERIDNTEQTLSAKLPPPFASPRPPAPAPQATASAAAEAAATKASETAETAAVLEVAATKASKVSAWRQSLATVAESPRQPGEPSDLRQLTELLEQLREPICSVIQTETRHALAMSFDEAREARKQQRPAAAIGYPGPSSAIGFATSAALQEEEEVPCRSRSPIRAGQPYLRDQSFFRERSSNAISSGGGDDPLVRQAATLAGKQSHQPGKDPPRLSAADLLRLR